MIEGQLQLNDYTLLQKAGEGATSKVYKVEKNGAHFALHISKHSLESQMNIYKRLDEVRGVPKVYDAFRISSVESSVSEESLRKMELEVSEGCYAMVQEFVSGSPIDKYTS
jgi:serine/threonine protein kinase